MGLALGRSRAAVWPLAVAWILYALSVTGIACACRRLNDGHMVYALDDTYIHMTIARNLAVSGTYGVCPGEFNSASSSPGWTFLLAGVTRVFGASDWPPLLLNVLFALAALAVAYRVGGLAAASPRRRMALLLAILLLTPMIPVTFAGMEHMLHLFAVLLLACFLMSILAVEGPAPAGAVLGLCLAAAVAVAARYESLFFVAAAAGVLVFRRRWGVVLPLVLSAAVPAVMMGAFSMAHGQGFLPNSVLLKGSMPSLHTAKDMGKALGGEALLQLPQIPSLYALLVCAVLLLAWRLRKNRRTEAADLLLIAAVATMLLHVQFARTGWFYRYEAYLVALMVTALFLAIPETLDLRSAGSVLAAGAVLAVLLLPPIVRGAKALWETPRATQNIYQQQYQTGLFLRNFYRDAPVAVNDIGAVNYLADIRCVDLAGLGTYEVARARQRGEFSTDAIRRLVRDRGVKVAVLYASLFRDGSALPAEWIPVGSWEIRQNVVCGDRTVTFFATEPSEAPRLLRNLLEFRGRLPGSVTWKARWSLPGEIGR